jgi:hypothetical protein
MRRRVRVDEVTWEEMLGQCVDAAIKLEGAKFPAILGMLRAMLHQGYAQGFQDGYAVREEDEK